MEKQLYLFDEPELVTFSKVQETAEPALRLMQQAVFDAFGLLARCRRKFGEDFAFDSFGIAQFLQSVIVTKIKTAIGDLGDDDIVWYRRRRMFIVRYRNVAQFVIKELDDRLARKNSETPHNRSFWTQRPDEPTKLLFGFRPNDSFTQAKTYIVLPEGMHTRDWIPYPDQWASAAEPAQPKTTPKVTAPAKQKGYRVKPRSNGNERKERSAEGES